LVWSFVDLPVRDRVRLGACPPPRLILYARTPGPSQLVVLGRSRRRGKNERKI
jgi:hypothetical protein